MRKRSEREQAFATELGARLRKARTVRRLSRAKFSQEMGISNVTVYNYECGKRSIPLYLLLRYAVHLQVPFADLVGPALRKSQTIVNGALTGN